MYSSSWAQAKFNLNSAECLVRHTLGAGSSSDRMAINFGVHLVQIWIPRPTRGGTNRDLSAQASDALYSLTPANKRLYLPSLVSSARLEVCSQTAMYVTIGVQPFLPPSTRQNDTENHGQPEYHDC